MYHSYLMPCINYSSSGTQMVHQYIMHPVLPQYCTKLAPDRRLLRPQAGLPSCIHAQQILFVHPYRYRTVLTLILTHVKLIFQDSAGSQ